MIRVCFVCLGNICRSPTAEAVMRHLVQAEGLEQVIDVDSAGTAQYHVGEAPDRRAQAAARLRGMKVTGRARHFGREDFDRFDYVLAMDHDNYETLQASAPSPEARGKVHLFRSFDREAPRGGIVPDPYYGGEQGFDDVLDMCEAAARGLIAHIRKEHGV